MPAKDTVLRWLREDRDGFRSHYEAMKQSTGEHWADEIVEIADTCDDPHKARLQIDARKWVLSKLIPKKYGDKAQMEVEHSGDIKIEINKNW